jgi:hypothetical protein
MGKTMSKFCNFGDFRDFNWPEPRQLERYFFAPPGKEWLQNPRNDGAVFRLQGAYGTEHLGLGKGLINIHLQIWGKPDLGVLLVYSRLGGGYGDVFSSKGDMSRIREWVRSTHGDPLPIGLFIPFAPAFQAVKEFIETDGKLPKNIEWIANKDLPPNTFPDRWIVLPGEKRR